MKHLVEEEVEVEVWYYLHGWQKYLLIYFKDIPKNILPQPKPEGDENNISTDTLLSPSSVLLIRNIVTSSKIDSHLKVFYLYI